MYIYVYMYVYIYSYIHVYTNVYIHVYAGGLFQCLDRPGACLCRLHRIRSLVRVVAHAIPSP